ncbi:hypothetical protein EON62_06110, partial [archaeon]
MQPPRGIRTRVVSLRCSTVHGNMPLELTTANALKVANVAGLNHIPVVAGAAKPLMRLSKACPEIHGGVCACAAATCVYSGCCCERTMCARAGAHGVVQTWRLQRRGWTRVMALCGRRCQRDAHW